MKRFFTRLWQAETMAPHSQEELELRHTCAGRLVSALTFIIVIACLGLWITSFSLIMEAFSQGSLPAFELGNLYCITFFGGLVAAILVGALAGNFLRRAFWSWLVRHHREDLQARAGRSRGLRS